MIQTGNKAIAPITLNLPLFGSYLERLGGSYDWEDALVVLSTLIYQSFRPI